MRIALRTSGGRGEYELAGRQGFIHASDLFGKHLFYEFTPSIIIPGRAVATQVQGKPRIRLADQQATTHFYRLLAGVLLLPKPKREFRETHGAQLIKREAYCMTAIKVDIGRVQASRVVLRPTDLLLQNSDNLQDKLGFAERMSRVVRLWQEASKQAGPIAQLINEHMQTVLAPNPDHKAIEDVADRIGAALQTDGDALAAAEGALGVRDVELQPEFSGAEMPDQGFAEDDETSPIEARVERVREWRQVAVRGAAGARFRSEVTRAYDFRCLFSGQRLPKTDVTESPGVDAAHILPWSTHDLNSVKNGVCLSKLCHWALDAGVVRISYDRAQGAYILEIPERVRSAAATAGLDLDYFDQISGPIPPSRLPAERARWPSPSCLDELNRFVFGS